jgi:hypothetical protein
MTEPEPFKFQSGQRVFKHTGDYQFHGEIRACYHTRAGKARYVVEPDNYGLQMIYNADQLRIADEEARHD